MKDNIYELVNYIIKALSMIKSSQFGYLEINDQLKLKIIGLPENQV